MSQTWYFACVNCFNQRGAVTGKDIKHKPCHKIFFLFIFTGYFFEYISSIMKSIFPSAATSQLGFHIKRKMFSRDCLRGGAGAEREKMVLWSQVYIFLVTLEYKNIENFQLILRSWKPLSKFSLLFREFQSSLNILCGCVPLHQSAPSFSIQNTSPRSITFSRFWF